MPKAIPTTTIVDDYAAIAAAMREQGSPALDEADDDDPALALYRRWRPLEDAAACLEQQHAAIRAGMVERLGEPDERRPWLCEWDYPELMRLDAELTRLTEASADLIEEMKATLATSLAGVVAKLKVVLEIWPSESEGSDFHHDAAYAFMKDAVRLLGSAES